MEKFNKNWMISSVVIVFNNVSYKSEMGVSPYSVFNEWHIFIKMMVHHGSMDNNICYNSLNNGELKYNDGRIGDTFFFFFFFESVKIQVKPEIVMCN